jgi:hypothetical protein
MATSKESRKAPSRMLENYVASIKKLFDPPETIPDLAFSASKFVVTDGSSAGYSEAEPIGFDIKINEKIYKEFAVSSAGWILLKDPDASTPAGPDFWNDFIDNETSPPDNVYSNQYIKDEFAYDHILLAPWFDRNSLAVRDVDTLISSCGYADTINVDTAAKIASGADARNWPFDEIDYGVRYTNYNDGRKGRCLLVRWTASQQVYNDELKFEIALYESGRIEYRYWPKGSFEQGDTPTADYSVNCPPPGPVCVESYGHYVKTGNSSIGYVYAFTNDVTGGPDYVLTQDSPFGPTLTYTLTGTGDDDGNFTFNGLDTFTEIGGLGRTIDIGISTVKYYNINCPPVCVESAGNYVKTGNYTFGYTYTLTNGGAGPSYVLTQDPPYGATLTYSLAGGDVDGSFTFNNIDTFTEIGGLGRTVLLVLTAGTYTVSCPPPPPVCTPSSGRYSRSDGRGRIATTYSLNNSGIGPSYTLTQQSPYDTSISYVLTDDLAAFSGNFTFDGSNTFTEVGGLERTIIIGDYPSDTNSATVGVFWSGPTAGSNQFRDLATLLDYSQGLRQVSEFGGCPYSASYSENSKPYSNEITSFSWPINGAVVTLAPPVNSAKFLPRQAVKDVSNTKKSKFSPGLFDDRKSETYGMPTSVSMPSTLPSRLLGDTGDVDVSSRQLLFTQGDLRIPNGRLSKSVIEDSLHQLEAMHKTNSSIDFSFNETEKNYKMASENSSFYSNVSSIRNFGAGFQNPLSSKTQFYLSLPVTKKTILPGSTPSLHYYDKSKNQWIMVDPNGYRSPESMTVKADPYGIEFDSPLYYRVTETSRAFDAAGRKIVSGSNIFSHDPIDNSTSLQTDGTIGSIFNHGGEKDLLNAQSEAISKSYSKSLTDNPDFYPSPGQLLDFSVEYPFLIEKIVVDLPFRAEGDWFRDFTTCTRAYGNDFPANLVPSGAMDFGGPALTFAVMCPRRGLGPNNYYMDLIASGTITHNFDNKSAVLLKKEATGGAPSLTHYYSLRPEGFKAFSNPTAVVEGKLVNSDYVFDGKVELELEASVAGGITLSRNDRSMHTAYISSNKSQAIKLLTSPTLSTKEGVYNNLDSPSSNALNYSLRSPRIHIQQVSPLSRGKSGLQFNGNSILGGTIASFNLEGSIKNPLFISSSGSLPPEIKTILDSNDFIFDAVSVYSTVDSQPSPYLIFPGDKLTLSLSKTRPVINKAIRTAGPRDGLYYDFTEYVLTGSHDTVTLNTGSINVTIYGSYVRNGTEYNP